MKTMILLILTLTLTLTLITSIVRAERNVMPSKDVNSGLTIILQGVISQNYRVTGWVRNISMSNPHSLIITDFDTGVEGYTWSWRRTLLVDATFIVAGNIGAYYTYPHGTQRPERASARYTCKPTAKNVVKLDRY